MKNAVVTGGTRGIGLQISRMLVEKGYTVYATYRKDDESAKKAMNEGINAVKLDSSNEEEVKAFFSTLKSIDVLVNNAGISLIRQIQDTTLAEWNEIMQTNLTSCFLNCREASKKMLSRGTGVIVNISSIWGERGGSLESAYSASKAGMIGFTKALASELGYAGIRVNAVCPGVIETSMNSHLSPEEQISLKEEIPVGRYGTPEEVASAVRFLLENEYANGTILSLNGGW